MGFDFNAVKRNAKRIGVDVKRSRTGHKKIDVLRGGKVVARVGDRRYDDYTMHKDAKRQQNYKKRFEKTRHRKNSPSFYADQLLWS